MAMRMALVYETIEHLLAKLFVVITAQIHLQEVDRILSKPFEVVLPPSRIEQHPGNDFIITVEIIDMRRPNENSHLLVYLRCNCCRHREQGSGYLFAAHPSASTVRNHRRHKRRQSLLALGIKRRAG